MSQAEENEQIRRAQQGDRAAFDQLVDAYWQRIYRWLYGLTRDSPTAEDLAQEAFVKAWVKLQLFQTGTHFRCWLFQIAGNCFRDNRRARRGAARMQALPETLSARDPEPATILLGQEIQAQVEMAVAALPVALRAPLLLRIQEQLSFQEIAAALGLTEETARWRVFKARRLLLQQLKQALEESNE